MNRKGELLLRDLFFMMIIFTGIILGASIFIGEMATEYENTNISDEYAGSSLYSEGNSSFYSVAQELEELGEEMSNGGILALVGGGLEAGGKVLLAVIGFPTDIGNMAESTLISLEVSDFLASIIGTLITTLIWVIIVFTIISAFLSGGKI